MTSGAGEDRNPQVSLDGRRLIYTNVRNSFSLELLNATTGRKASLATRRTTISGPRFSPQGDRITFFHEIDAGTHLFTLGVDGHDLRQITAKNRRAKYPAALVGQRRRAFLSPDPPEGFVSESFCAWRRFHRSRTLAVEFVG